MSWTLFKVNILRKTNPNFTINSINEVAAIWADEYDAAVKRGKDFVNFESVQRGNKVIMESLFRVALLKGLSTLPGQNFSLVNEFGNGVKAYWAGAQMKPLPLPLIPAPGSIQNISVNSNVVFNVGTWPIYPPLKPARKQEIMVDMFILAALIHLFSIGGIIQTTSLYPSVPTPIPAPGIIPWTGYLVPPTIPIPNINFPSEDNNEPPVIEQPDGSDGYALNVTNQSSGTNNGQDGGTNNGQGSGTNNGQGSGTNNGQGSGTNNGQGNILGGDTSLQNVLNVSLPDMSVDSFDVKAYIASFQQQLKDDGCCCD
jgi:hypothetical protein